MVRSHTVLVWTHYPAKKSLVVVVVGGGRPNLVLSPGPGLWSLVLGPFGSNLGADLELTWDLDLDLSLTIRVQKGTKKPFLQNSIIILVFTVFTSTVKILADFFFFSINK